MYTSVDGTSPTPLATQPSAGAQEMTIVTNLGPITVDVETPTRPAPPAPSRTSPRTATSTASSATG